MAPSKDRVWYSRPGVRAHLCRQRVATHQPRAHQPRERYIATRGGVHSDSDWYIATGVHSDHDLVNVSHYPILLHFRVVGQCI